MFLKKAPSRRLSESPSDQLLVTIEPRPGHTDEEILATLHKAGARAVQVLSPGFISAMAYPRSLDVLERIGRVHIRRESQFDH